MLPSIWRPHGMSIVRGIFVLTTLAAGMKRMVEQLLDGIAWVVIALWPKSSADRMRES